MERLHRLNLFLVPSNGVPTAIQKAQAKQVLSEQTPKPPQSYWGPVDGRFILSVVGLAQLKSKKIIASGNPIPKYREYDL